MSSTARRAECEGCDCDSLDHKTTGLVVDDVKLLRAHTISVTGGRIIHYRNGKWVHGKWVGQANIPYSWGTF